MIQIQFSRTAAALKTSFVFVMWLASLAPCSATTILDGSIEDQVALQGNLYIVSGGNKVGAGGKNWGWQSWMSNVSGIGVWVGGASAYSSDFTTGWKVAHDGIAFGIIKDREIMSQTFTATQDAIGSLTWYDANRNSWDSLTWFGSPNPYSVTLTDLATNTTQLLGNYTSQVPEPNRFTATALRTWFARSADVSFNLVANRQHQLSFNSLSPTYLDINGVLKIEDRTTLLDSITLSTTPTSGTGDPVPVPGTMGLISIAIVGCGWRLRQSAKSGQR